MNKDYSLRLAASGLGGRMVRGRDVQFALLKASLDSVFEQTCDLNCGDQWSRRLQDLQNTLTLAQRELELAVLEELGSGQSTH